MAATQKLSFDDAEALTQTLRDIAKTSDVSGLISVVVDLVMQLANDNKQLTDRVKKLLNRIYTSSSEKLSPSQLDLFQKMLEKCSDETSNQDEASKKDKGQEDSEKTDRVVEKLRRDKSKSGKAGHGRNKLPPHLKRVIISLEVAPSERQCDRCDTEKRCIGHTVSERLEYVPASLIVLQEKREKLACKPCQGSVSIAPLADHIIEGGLVGEGFLAHILASKFVDGLTLTRLAKIFRRSGVPFAESTLCDLVKQSTGVLPRLADVIKSRVLASPFINQDDSGLRVLDREHEKGMKRGHIWAYVAGADVVYEYAPNWSGEHPRSFLRNYGGIIQGDGYAGINKLFTSSDNVPTRAGCMMHCRRYFLEAYKAGEMQAGIALALINQIYVIEHNAKAQGFDEHARLALRKDESMPRMAQLQRFIAKHKARALPKSAFGQALTYANNQWDSLLVPFADGRLEIDNGEAERRLKVLATGRKNWLFAGSDEGAKRAALALTVLGTAVNYGLDPVAYLTDVFKQIAGGLPKSRFGELHPSVWAENKAQQTAAHQVMTPRLAG